MPPKTTSTFARKFESVFQRKRKALETASSLSNVVAEAAQLNTVKPIRDHDHGAKVLEVRHEPTNGIMSTAKTTLLFLKESSDAFPPLKSLVAGLLFLLENHERWRENQASLDKLIARLASLVRSNGTHEANINSAELNRQRILESEFATFARQLKDIETGSRAARYISTGEESSAMARITEGIHSAIIDYQFSLQKEMYVHIAHLVSQDDTNLLDKLPRARNADHLSGSHNTCHPGTRTDILWQLEAWVEDTNALRVYWLGGHAGSGKSTIAQSFCHRTFASGMLGASFFCSRDVIDRSDIKMIFPTLAFQLGCRFPKFRAHLVQVVRVRPDIGTEAMANQLRELLVNPLIASGISTTISIDALDECKDSEPASVILSLLARVIDELPKIKFFVTGRPEAAIRSGFRIPALRPHTEIIQLHEVNQAVDQDIAMYLGACLSDIVKNRSDFELSEVWPPPDKLTILVQKCEKLFIFASTAVKLLSSPHPFDPREGLDKITESPNNTLHEGEYGIDALYAHVLQQGSSPMAQESYGQLKAILGPIVLAYNPLSSSSLSELLQLPSNIIKTRLGGLHSLLMIPTSSSDAIRVHHKSFPDFLTDHRRCLSEQFYINPNVYHAKLAVACLDFMKKQLRKNICSLPPYAMNSDISLDRRRAYIGEPLEYACRFWVRHVCASATSSEQVDLLLRRLCEFLQERQILWLEVLSLVDDLRCSVYSFKHLEKWLSQVGSPISALALNWLQDGFHFVLRFFPCIQESAAHLYHSALPLSPRLSLLRQKHLSDLTSEVCIIRGAEDWDLSQGRRVASDSSCCAFSHRGDIIALQDEANVMILLDSMTGEHICTLADHRPHYADFNLSLFKFSVDDGLILSSKNTEVVVWDVQTGSLIKVYDGHKSSVSAVDFSIDKCWIASGDQDGGIIVWKRQSGEIVHKTQVTESVVMLFFCSSNDVLVVQTVNDLVLLTLSTDNIHTIYTDNPSDLDNAYTLQQVMMSENRTLLAYTTTLAPRRAGSYFHTFPCILSVYNLESRCSIWTMETSSQCLVIKMVENAAVLLTNISLQLVDLNDSNQIPVSFASHSMLGHDVCFTAIAPDKSRIAYIDFAGVLYLQEISDSQLISSTRKLPIDTIFFTSMQISTDGKMVAAWSRYHCEKILVWNAETNKEFFVTLQHAESRPLLFGLAISPDRKYLAARTSGRTFIANIAKDPISIISKFEHQSPQFLSFFDVESYITMSSTSDPVIEIWDVATGGRLATIHVDHHNLRWMQLQGVYHDCISVYTHENADRMWELAPLEQNPLCTQFYLEARTPAVSQSTYNPDCLLYPAKFDERWILNGHGKRILWLPEDSEPSGDMSNVLKWHGSTLVSGGYSGTLTVMDFSGVNVEIYDHPLYATDTILGFGDAFMQDLRQRGKRLHA